MSISKIPLAALQEDALLPPGIVMYFANSTAPNGWIKANGAAISRTAYSALFTAIGTTYGAGDGSTTFNLPDLRGEFIRSFDDGLGVDSERVFGSFQDATGIASHVNNNGALSLTNTENPVSAGTSAAASASIISTAKTRYFIRPRNVALLACIKF